MSWLGKILAPEMFPDTHLLVGIEHDPDEPEGLRLYVDARYTGRHVHVTPAGAEAAQRGYGGGQHVFADLDHDALCDCRPELTEALRRPPSEATP